MIYNSALTAQDLKDRFTRDKQDSTTDQAVRDALNDFYSMIRRFERAKFPNKNRTKATVSVGSSGYDISTLSNIGNTDIRVYLGDIIPENFLQKRWEGAQVQGYYMLDNTLYLTPTPSTAQTVNVYYYTKAPRITSATALSAHTLLIDQDLERAILKYFESLFFDGEYQYDLRNDAENKAMEELTRYFSFGDTAVFAI